MTGERPTAQELIEFFDLKPLPVEGGLFKRNYLADEVIPPQALPDRYQEIPHHYGSAIYALMTDDPDSFSAMHTLPTDEIYHFYLGDPIEMLVLYPDGDSEIVILGQEVFRGMHVQFVVPAEAWQGFRLLEGGEYGLIGTTMAPGFEVSDYRGGDREALVEKYPSKEEMITALTRPDEPLHRSY